MKTLSFVILVALLGGGWWISQPEQNNLRRDLQTLVTQQAREASTHIAQQSEKIAREAAKREANKRLAQGEARPTATPASKPQNALSKYETLLCDLANEERRKRGLPLMKISPQLAEMARAHSREMQQKNFFAHESPTPSRRAVMDRYKLQFGRSPRLVAENIYMLKTSGPYQLTERDFRRAHEGWMKSPGHRANILRSSPVSPAEIGVGIFIKDNSFWATQNFATPMKQG